MSHWPCKGYAKLPIFMTMQDKSITLLETCFALFDGDREAMIKNLVVILVALVGVDEIERLLREHHINIAMHDKVMEKEH